MLGAPTPLQVQSHAAGAEAGATVAEEIAPPRALNRNSSRAQGFLNCSGVRSVSLGRDLKIS